MNKIPSYAACLIGLCLVVPRTSVAQPQLTPEQARALRELDGKASEAYAAGEYEAGLLYVQEMLKVVPNEPDMLYNMACFHALLGHKEEAMTWMDKSVSAGFDNIDLLRRDTDLDSLREDPRFARYLVRVEQASQRAPNAPAVDEDYVRIIEPPGYDTAKKYPVVIVLHRYGRSADHVAEHWKDAAAQVGALLVAPQAPLPMSSTAFQWGDAGKANETVLKTLERIKASYGVDEEHIVLGGFSQGAAMAVGVGLANPDLFCGLLPVAGRIRPPPPGVLSGAGAKKLRVCVLVGAEDKQRADAAREVLPKFEQAGLVVRLNVYPGVAQDYPENRTEELVKALQFAMGR
jgi:predicted esterase